MRRPDPRVMLLMAACFSTMGVLIDTTWLMAAVFAFVVLFSHHKIKKSGRQLQLLVQACGIYVVRTMVVHRAPVA